jgi:hypothetical protein
MGMSDGPMTSYGRAITVAREKGVPTGGLRMLQLDGTGDPVAAAISPENTDLLLVDVTGDTVTVRDRRSAGVWLHSTELADRRWLALECRDTSLTSVFEALADEVQRAVSGVPSRGRRSVVQDRLERWRLLLSRGPSGRISREVEIGLHGELTILRTIAADDADRALAAWQGPAGAPNDLVDPEWAIEVKATVAQSAFRIQIHGLAQLDHRRSSAPLHLAAVRLDELPSGRTLPKLVDELATVLDRPGFLERLALTGYEHETAGEHDWLSLKVEETGLWRIDDHVPALRASDLDPSFLAAIGKVRYELDVSALGDRMDEHAMRGLWGGA